MLIGMQRGEIIRRRRVVEPCELWVWCETTSNWTGGAERHSAGAPVLSNLTSFVKSGSTDVSHRRFSPGFKKTQGSLQGPSVRLRIRAWASMKRLSAALPASPPIVPSNPQFLRWLCRSNDAKICITWRRVPLSIPLLPTLFRNERIAGGGDSIWMRFQALVGCNVQGSKLKNGQTSSDSVGIL